MSISSFSKAFQSAMTMERTTEFADQMECKALVFISHSMTSSVNRQSEHASDIVALEMEQVSEARRFFKAPINYRFPKQALQISY